MEDIEDMFKDETMESRPVTKKAIRKQPKPKKTEGEDAAITDPMAAAEDLPPGAHNIFVKTYGCSHNISDGEYMAGLLSEYGFKMVDSMEESHACLLNSCTVKNPSQEKFINQVAKARGMGKPVIVSGCVPQGDRNLKGLEDVSILGVT